MTASPVATGSPLGVSASPVSVTLSAVPPEVAVRIVRGHAPRGAGMMSAAWRRWALRCLALTASLTYGRLADDVRWQIPTEAAPASVADVRASADASAAVAANTAISRASRRLTLCPPFCSSVLSSGLRDRRAGGFRGCCASGGTAARASSARAQARAVRGRRAGRGSRSRPPRRPRRPPAGLP
jgi:hypothetical protein